MKRRVEEMEENYKNENERLSNENQQLSDAVDQLNKQYKKLKEMYCEEKKNYEGSIELLIKERDDAILENQKNLKQIEELNKKIESQSKSNNQQQFRSFITNLISN